MNHLIHRVGDRDCGSCGDLGDQFTSMTGTPLRKRGGTCDLPRDGQPCRDGTSCPRCRELYGLDACRNAPESTPEEDAMLRGECEWQAYRDSRYRRD